MALLGLNGAGKSTLVKAILGIVKIFGGQIELEGEQISGLRTDEVARRGVGYVPQTDAVFQGLSVRENLIMGGYTLKKGAIDQRITEVISSFPALGALLDRTTAKLSGGEQRLVAIGRVLMKEPKAIILDEPTASLAPSVAAAMLSEQLQALREAEVATLIVEQRVRACLQVADWAYVLANGAVQKTGAATDLLKDDGLVGVLIGGAQTGHEVPLDDIAIKQRIGDNE